MRHLAANPAQRAQQAGAAAAVAAAARAAAALAAFRGWPAVMRLVLPAVDLDSRCAYTFYHLPTGAARFFWLTEMHVRGTAAAHCGPAQQGALWAA